MKWYICGISNKWGIEISPKGSVTTITHIHELDKLADKEKPEEGEKALNDDLRIRAFEDIVNNSEEGARELAKKLKGSDRAILYDVIFTKLNWCVQLLEILADNS